MRQKWKYGWLRSPKTTQEIRRNSQPEERPFVRGKRLPRNLPNAWDDTQLGCWRRHQCWKRLRETQYRPKVA